MYAEAILKKGEGRTLKSGGAWVYDNEIDRVEGDYENGDILAVKDFDGFFLGWGFINTRSKITIRVMSRRKEHEITEEFLEKRVRNAWEYRKATVDTGCCRLIFGEADWLPGLVVDKFSDVLWDESLALGIDRLKPTILSLVKKVLAEDGIMIRGIYERSDAKVRLQEGMERFKGFIGDRSPQRLKSQKMVSVTSWMWKTDKRPDFSWTEIQQTGNSQTLPRQKGYWTALPIPVLLH